MFGWGGLAAVFINNPGKKSERIVGYISLYLCRLYRAFIQVMKKGAKKVDFPCYFDNFSFTKT